MTTKVRPFKVFKKEEFAYKHTSCIASIKVKKNKNIKECIIAINGTPLQPSSTDKEFWIFDFEQIRNTIREYLGETQYENDCLRLESTLTFNQLKCIQHYTIHKNTLKNIVFTSGIIFQFIPSTPVDLLECEEIVYISDQQLAQQKEEK
jgi:hypothetical protein